MNQNNDQEGPVQGPPAAAAAAGPDCLPNMNYNQHTNVPVAGMPQNNYGSGPGPGGCNPNYQMYSNMNNYMAQGPQYSTYNSSYPPPGPPTSSMYGQTMAAEGMHVQHPGYINSCPPDQIGFNQPQQPMPMGPYPNNHNPLPPPASQQSFYGNMMNSMATPIAPVPPHLPPNHFAYPNSSNNQNNQVPQMSPNRVPAAMYSNSSIPSSSPGSEPSPGPAVNGGLRSPPLIRSPSFQSHHMNSPPIQNCQPSSGPTPPPSNSGSASSPISPRSQNDQTENTPLKSLHKLASAPNDFKTSPIKRDRNLDNRRSSSGSDCSKKGDTNSHESQKTPESGKHESQKTHESGKKSPRRHSSGNRTPPKVNCSSDKDQKADSDSSKELNAENQESNPKNRDKLRTRQVSVCDPDLDNEINELLKEGSKISPVVNQNKSDSNDKEEAENSDIKQEDDASNDVKEEDASNKKDVPDEAASTSSKINDDITSVVSTPTGTPRKRIRRPKGSAAKGSATKNTRNAKSAKRRVYDDDDYQDGMDVDLRSGKTGKKLELPGKFNKRLKNKLSVASRIGPFIKVKGTRRHPTSCDVINATSLEDEKLSQSKKKQNFIAEDNDISSVTLTNAPWVCCFCGRGSTSKNVGDLFGPYFIQGYQCNQTFSDSPKSRKRQLQQQDSDDGSDFSFGRGKKSRKLKDAKTLGRGSKRASKEGEAWVHEDCATWSEGIYMTGSKLHGLKEAIKSASKSQCSGCKLPGASIGCLQKGCGQKFHFFCARDKGCQLIEENFSMVCPKHKNKVRMMGLIDGNS